MNLRLTISFFCLAGALVLAMPEPWARAVGRVAAKVELDEAPAQSTAADPATRDALTTAASDDRGATDAEPARAGSATGDDAGDAGDRMVFVVPVEGEFEAALHLFMVRAMREAHDRGADAVILDMDTLGGRVDAAMNIRDVLMESRIKTYTYVNSKAISAGSFIAVATDVIVMGPNSSIGGALPIQMSDEGAKAADRKFISVFAAEMRKTAKTKGHPVDIAEGFCNPDVEIEGLKEKGDILTLDYDQAVTYGLSAFQAETLDELLAIEGFAGATIETFEMTGADRIARFLSSSAVMSLLILLGIGGLWLEFKTPGFGIFGIVGISALILYFYGSYLANLSGYLEWIAFALGLILLAVEIFVVPGFGVFGVAGIGLIAGSLFFALFNLAPEDGWNFDVTAPRMREMGEAAAIMLAALLALIPAIWVALRLVRVTPAYDGLVLTPEMAGVHSDVAQSYLREELPVAQGDIGLAVTHMFPTGVAEFGDRRLDVLTEGEQLNRGDRVEVIRVEGSRIYVRRAREQPDAG